MANNCNCASCKRHSSNYVSPTSKPVSTKTVCKPVRIMNYNKTVIFSTVYKPRSFVTCKPVCFGNVIMVKNFNSVNYCLGSCTKHSVNVISSIMRKSDCLHALLTFILLCKQ